MLVGVVGEIGLGPVEKWLGSCPKLVGVLQHIGWGPIEGWGCSTRLQSLHLHDLPIENMLLQSSTLKRASRSLAKTGDGKRRDALDVL